MTIEQPDKVQPVPPNPLPTEVVPIDSISPDPANVRKHTDKNIQAIIASLRRR